MILDKVNLFISAFKNSYKSYLYDLEGKRLKEQMNFIDAKTHHDKDVLKAYNIALSKIEDDLNKLRSEYYISDKYNDIIAKDSLDKKINDLLEMQATIKIEIFETNNRINSTVKKILSK